MTPPPSTLEELLAQAAPDDVSPAPLAAIHAGARRRRTRRRAGITLAGVAVVALACAPSLLGVGTSTMHSLNADESSGDAQVGSGQSAASTEDPSVASASGGWEITLTSAAAATVPAPASAGDDVAPDQDVTRDQDDALSSTFTASALPIETTLSSTRLRVAATCGEMTFAHAPALTTRAPSASSPDGPQRLAAGTRAVRLLPTDGPEAEGAATCRAMLAEIERSAATVTRVQVIGADTVVYQDAAGRTVLVVQRSQED